MSPRAARTRRDWLQLGMVALLVMAAPSGAFAVSPCQISYPSDALVEWTCRRLASGETLQSVFGEQWTDVARFNRIDRRHAVAGVSIKAPVRLADIAGFSPLPEISGAGEDDAQLIIVDLGEQFAGAYEHGRLAFALPIASGRASHPTPTGEFRISAFDRDHRSSLYFVQGTRTRYPMHYGLRFHVTPGGVAYWMHGRDMPGFPASHGCIGLFDEPMQKTVYRSPKEPVLMDARRLYEWVIGDLPDRGNLELFEGPRVIVRGDLPAVRRAQK